MAKTPVSQRIITGFLIASGVMVFLYIIASLSVAIIITNRPQKPVTTTPASYGLSYREVSFLSREDHLLLRGWLIPGKLPDGRLTVERTIIQVHGAESNRAQALDIDAQIVRHGIAVLAFDTRGSGESVPAPKGGGYFEQQDVLGAVDFLHSGPVPYPELGRPQAIGGWGISSGGDAIIYAAAKEPAIQAIVIDSAYATMAEYMEPAFGIYSIIIPGTRYSEMMLYGLDYTHIRPVDVIARIAPRPIFLIHGADDIYIQPSNMTKLATAAKAAPDASVQTWLVPNANHIQAYHRAESAYIDRLVNFFFTGLHVNG